ncbi:aspartyl aminopeptidase domain protein, partial [Ostertagia ostertagi]
CSSGWVTLDHSRILYKVFALYTFCRNRGTCLMNLQAMAITSEKEKLCLWLQLVQKFVGKRKTVQECRERLLQAGFEELTETTRWDIKPMGKYFVTKNRSAIIAFAVGGSYVPGNGFAIVVAHTDSPCLRVKPVSKVQSEKFNQVGVSTYGGGLWRTWFDRDLSVAGEVVFRAGDTLARRLINIDHPILYIPNLAIHLTKDRENFTCNNETHLRPILETFAMAGINSSKKDPLLIQSDAPKDPRDVVADHHANFLDLVAVAAHTTADQVVDLDLYLYDSNPAVGSQTAMGAQSSFTEYVLRRLAAGGEGCSFEEAIGRSILVSADQAHAAHPNYGDQHETNHRPSFHEGVVVKVNVNQRYATTSTTHAVLKQIAAEANVPLQKVVVRNDSPCGSTVGPILAARLGIQTIDVGCPQLAMHSIREMIDTSSLTQATRLYATFFNRMRYVLPSLM